MVTGDEKEQETSGEERVSRLERKVEKVRIKPREPEVKKPEEPVSKGPLKPGDAVRMTETLAAGEIVEVNDKTVILETGSLRLKVPVDKVERISRAELKKSIRASQPLRENDPGLVQRNLTFSPEIDIRGMRGDEALAEVRDLIDNALIVRHRNLRILHGKGNGILRQLVRQYLDTVGVVRSFRDEHVEFGGSGITVVEMDL